MFRFSKIFFTKVLGDFFYFLFAKLQSLLYRPLLNNKLQASKFFNLIIISISFKKVPNKERQGVKFFVSYMSNTFKSVKNRFFKTSIHIVDRYHFIRQVSWALENVRKRIQKDISYKLRKYFKKSRNLFIKPASKLTTDQAKEVYLMLDFSNDLKLTYRLKELFYCVPCGYQYVLTQPNRVRATKSLKEWIRRAEESNLKEFKSCTTAFNKWFDEICNSFDYP